MRVARGVVRRSLTDSASPWSGAALVRAVRIHVFGWEGGLLGRAVDLLRRPGRVAAVAMARDRDVFGEPLRLFLLANVVFFLIGPSIGLMAFTLDSLASTPGYAEAVEAQIARLGVEVPLYRERFNAAFRFRQPTFVILLAVPLSLSGRVLLRRQPLGRHLALSLLFFAWVLLAWPALRLAGLGVGALVPAAGAVLDPVLLAVLLGSTVVVARSLWAGGFGLRPGAAWAAGVATTGVLLLSLAAYGHLLFWVTFAMMEWGG